MATERSCEILVAGAGPAGLAAGFCAAERGRSVLVVDDNPFTGGQIWRGRQGEPVDEDAGRWLGLVLQVGAELILGANIIDHPAENALAVATPEPLLIRYEKLIVATGARELFLPFPGWTLPGVTGAGGLQALVKGGLEIEGKSVAVAGSGPLLLAVAGYLREHGARIEVIAEQAPLTRVARFGLSLGARPAKLLQAMNLRQAAANYTTGCWPVEARRADGRLQVVFHTGRGSRTVECDYLACGFGLVPNLELPLLLGCETSGGFVAVDQWQESSVPGIYCAGELTGIAGVESAVAEGQIAGYAAAGRQDEARAHFSTRDDARRFGERMKTAFALRDELRHLATPETIVCRCEDITTAELDGRPSWRSAKLHTRCGMGACQGRVCGAATRYLYGWGPDSVRPPLVPIPLENLAEPVD